MSRLSAEQQTLLKEAFDYDPNWSNLRIAELSERLGLSRGKIYKWNWDQRNKAR
jgi:hypothetical protein